jgi:hypothetical protein
VPVINVLYLPRDERLRTIVRTALDFVEEVYKQGFLAGIRFASFNLDDKVDVELAKRVADREGFTRLVERVGRVIEPKSMFFYLPHSDTALQYVWVPVFRGLEVWAPALRGLKASKIYDIVVHEITHLAFDRLPEGLKNALVNSFRIDVNIDDVIREHGFSPALVQSIAELVHEVAVLYITYNYFVELKKSPEIPTTQTYIKEFALDQYRGIITEHGPKPRYPASVLAELFYRIARTDLASLRMTAHRVFETMINKFPADVYESNRAKYEILYREHGT